MEEAKQENATEKLESGVVWFKDKWRHFYEFEELQTKRRKGQVLITLGDVKVKVYKENIRRFPLLTEAKKMEIEQKNKKEAQEKALKSAARQETIMETQKETEEAMSKIMEATCQLSNQLKLISKSLLDAAKTAESMGMKGQGLSQSQGFKGGTGNETQG